MQEIKDGTPNQVFRLRIMAKLKHVTLGFSRKNCNDDLCKVNCKPFQFALVVYIQIELYLPFDCSIALILFYHNCTQHQLQTSPDSATIILLQYLYVSGAWGSTCTLYGVVQSQNLKQSWILSHLIPTHLAWRCLPWQRCFHFGCQGLQWEWRGSNCTSSGWGLCTPHCTHMH